MQTKYQIEINVREADTGGVVAGLHAGEFDDESRAHDFAFALAKAAAAFGNIEPDDPMKRARELHGVRIAYRNLMNRPW